MNYFIKNIHINKLFHLENFDIPIANEKYPHLIITGKNGSGKTVLLNAIVKWFEEIKKEPQLKSSEYVKYYDYDKDDFASVLSKLNEYTGDKKNKSGDKDVLRYLLWTNAITKKTNKESHEIISDIFNDSSTSVVCNFTNNQNILKKIRSKDFILAYYSAQRGNSELKMVEPKSPTKPELNINVGITETYTDKFLEFLSDLRIQGALARNEKQLGDAHRINHWFRWFVKLLKQIFQDDALKLEFDYRNYSFKICTEGKKFKFTELADGFAAVLDIVADLILKMQKGDTLTRVYEKEDIVLIDEIETHLHLSMQKIIMPLLTNTFPNIQFIITTHSPFVLSSMPNAVAYDLEHREVLDDLTEYSYESLAEGYFGVRTQSSYAEMQLETLKKLLEKEIWTDSDKVEIKQLKSDFEKIPETVSPLVVGGFRQMMIQYADKLKSL